MVYTCRRCSSEYAQGDTSCPTCGASTNPGAPAGDETERPTLAEDLLRRLRAATEGEFEVIQEIGHGGMARVYLAHEIVLERLVALKVLSPLFSEYPEIVRRFQHEARTAGQLSHPNIVPVFAVYQRQGLSFFSMPYVAGISLRQLLQQRGALGIEEAMAFVLQAAAGLAYAHDNGVVHRDVKPENMMLEEPHSRLVLTDFGLAKALGGESLTVPGDMIGTPHYMSPEQCEGRSEVDGRSDQYSLALVAYELLTGKHPFGKAGFRQVMMKQLNEDPPPLREQRPDVPGRIADAIHKALSKDLKDRFATIYGFGEVLAGAETSTFAVPSADPRSARMDHHDTPDAKTIWMRERVRRAHRRRHRLLRAAIKVRRYVRRKKALVGAAAAVLILVSGAAIARGAGSLDLARMASMLGQDDGAMLSFNDVDPGLTAERFQATGPRPVDRPEGAREPAGGTPTNDRSSEPETEGPETATPQPGRTEKPDAGGTAIARRSDPVDGSQPSSNGGSSERTDEPRTASGDGGRESNGRPTNQPAGTDGGNAPPNGADRGGPASPLDSTGTGEDGPGEPLAGGDELGSDGSGSDQPTGEGSGPASEEGTESAADALAGLIEEYRLALENEDLEALSNGVYRGEIPAKDLELLRRIFDNADDLKVDLQLPPLEPDGDRARFKIEHRMRFLQAVTKREQTFKRKLELTFEQDDDGWKLVQVKQ